MSHSPFRVLDAFDSAFHNTSKISSKSYPPLFNCAPQLGQVDVLQDHQNASSVEKNKIRQGIHPVHKNHLRLEPEIKQTQQQARNRPVHSYKLEKTQPGPWA
jgi:hypothetical protein